MVRFTPESGHLQARPKCLLSANSGHRARFTPNSGIQREPLVAVTVSFS